MYHVDHCQNKSACLLLKKKKKKKKKMHGRGVVCFVMTCLWTQHPLVAGVGLGLVLLGHSGRLPKGTWLWGN